MATKADLRNRVLRRLKRLASGQTAPAELSTPVEETLDELFAELRADNIVYGGPDIDEIPDEAVRACVGHAASELAQEFALTPQRRIELQTTGPVFLGRLRSLARPSVSTDPVEIEYF